MAMNCYAYACKCTNPAGSGQALPGGYAGSPVQLKGESADDLAKRYIEGVKADMEKNNIEVKIHDQKTPHETPKPSDGNYLIAMVSKSDGFHFFRRDTNGLWSWKDGDKGAITGQVTKINKVFKDKLCNVDDVVLQQMVTTTNAYYPSWGLPWQFRAYIELPDGGMTVAGKIE